MSSTLLLRTLLIASALSGALVFACGEDTTQNTDNSNADDDDDGDDDDDDTDKRDAGRDSGKTDARVADGGRRDGAAAPGCSGFGQMCMDDDGNQGFQSCTNGQLGPCMVAVLGDASTVETCPDGFTCTMIPIGNTALCTKGGLQSLAMLTCQAAEECADLGLEGAACSQVPMLGGICRLPCVPGGGTTPQPDAGGGDEEDAGDEEPASDAGSTGGDAGRDSGSSGSSDAGRDAGRDR